MPSLKLTLLAVVAFAAPLAMTVAFQMTSEPTVPETAAQPRIGKVLFFSSPG